MSAFPFSMVFASKRPASLGPSAGRLWAVWALGYNIAQDGGRTGLEAAFFAAFYRGTPEWLPASIAGTSDEEGK
jgi:hypothetical protein